MSTPALPSLFRGVYHRVARRLGVDPSYVSRVARQERRSDAISAALKKEVDRILLASQTVLAQSVAAQLDLAATFCSWARRATAQRRRDDGCVACARQAAESAFRFLARLPMEADEFEYLRMEAKRLKLNLNRLEQERQSLSVVPQNGVDGNSTKKRANKR
jgi:DNA-binding transcriptional regulator YdaS (Cro superfamily)